MPTFKPLGEFTQRILHYTMLNLIWNQKKVVCFIISNFHANWFRDEKEKETTTIICGVWVLVHDVGILTRSRDQISRLTVAYN